VDVRDVLRRRSKMIKWAIKVNKKHPDYYPGAHPKGKLWVEESLDIYNTKAKRKLFKTRKEAVQNLDPNNPEEVVRVEI